MPKAAEKTLIIILSETRAHELTFPGFKANFLEPLGADLALCVADNPREDQNNPFYMSADYIWTYPEPDDWADGFDWIADNEGWHGDWRQLLKIKDQWLGGIRDPIEGHPGSGGILLFFRYFLRKSLKESGALEQYDRFIITRSDYMHTIPHLPINLLSRDKIWIPRGEDYGGVTDRQIIANREDILSVLSIADDVFTKPDQLYERMHQHQHWNIEQFIKSQFDFYGLSKRVRRYPATMFAVRARDGHTSWAKGIYDDKLGYFVKYPKEYRRYLLCSKFVSERTGWNRLKIWIINTLNFVGF